MTDDERLAEIRARHEEDDRALHFASLHVAHEDRAALLALVEALRRERDEARAEVSRQGALIDQTAKHWLELVRTHRVAWEGAIDGAMEAACAEIVRARAREARLKEAGRMFDRAYVRLMESGRDRIADLGGECDPLDVMECGDPWLKAFRAAFAASERGS